jgi:sugar phosphate isomerase/epimerase
VRKLLDDLGVKCYSTHNASSYVTKENIGKTRDRCGILGCKYVVVASTDVEGQGIDGWRKFADVLNEANDGLASAQMHSGYHNHKTEFVAVDGVRPIEVLAKNTKPTVMLQLDVGTCLEAGGDPVAWIKANPGRIRSLHLKDWSPDAGKGYIRGTASRAGSSGSGALIRFAAIQKYFAKRGAKEDRATC